MLKLISQTLFTNSATYRLHYLSDTTTDSSNGKRSDSTDPSYITITYTPLSTSRNASQSVATTSVGSIIKTTTTLSSSFLVSGTSSLTISAMNTGTKT
uniref:Uncharacterized protein n=1 Tax=Romanomermis culicivorax TaxID=13658 RepID=A0A915IBI4_ROMCU